MGGTVVRADVIRQGKMQRSLGYGFVAFEDLDAANKAVASMNQTELEGRVLNVEIARKREPKEDKSSKNTVFVSNVPFTATADDLRAVFEQAGLSPTKVSVLMRRKVLNKNKGYGFVQLASEEEQAQAVERLNNAEMEGRQLIVKVALPRRERNASASPSTSQS